ncbi:hypothetical protein A5644_08910 [Mycobacterium intracellulare subsp. yongonense]|nr:hypothetical protein A5644_08910 [Mycobacterium intracellulare subsp. yongonense]
MRGIERRGLQRRGDQRFDPLITDHPGPTRPRLVEQPVEAIGGESIAPLGHHSPRDTQIVCYRGITRIPFAGKHDP